MAKQKLKRKARQIGKNKKLVGKVSKAQKMPTPSQKKVGLSLATLDDLASRKQIFSDNTEQDLIIPFQDDPQILEIPTQDKPQIPEIPTQDNPQIPEKNDSAKEIDCTKKKKGGKEKLCSHKSCRPLKNTACFFSASPLPSPLFHPPPSIPPPHFPDRFNFHRNNSFPNNFHGKNSFPNNFHQNNTFPNNFYGNNTVPDNFRGNNTVHNNFYGNDTSPNIFHENNTFHKNNTFQGRK